MYRIRKHQKTSGVLSAEEKEQLEHPKQLERQVFGWNAAF